MNFDRRTFAYLVLIFFSGLLLGGTLMNLAEHYWLHAEPTPEDDISQHRKIAERMKERLHLSLEQQSQVDEVLQQTLSSYQALQHRLAPQFDALRRQDRDHLRAILTPAQRQTYDQIVQQVDARYPVNERPEALKSDPCAPPAAGTAPAK